MATEKLLSASDNVNHEYCYIAPTRGQAKALIWDKLKDRFDEFGWKYDKRESELWIRRKSTNTKIHVKGAEKFDRIRGPGFNGVIFDEFADINIKAWKLAVRPTLSDRRGWCWFLGTPK